MARIRLVHWNAEEARERATTMAAFGYEVDHQLPNPPELLRQLKLDAPAAMVIDLDRLPSQGRDLAITIRRQKTTRNIPLVFVGGNTEKVTTIKTILPDAVYTSWDGIRNALKRAIAQPPGDPIIPESVFAAYTGKSLVKKLGINPGAQVLLINAPPGFKDLLTDLPEEVCLQESNTAGGDIAIWFVDNQTDLGGMITSMASQIGEASLWIAWPKESSGMKSDLTQMNVREAGLSKGLVDYKICAIDKTWSGLLFTHRKRS